MRGRAHGFAIAALLTLGGAGAEAQVENRVGLDFEGSLFWQNRNDVRIPNEDSATRFSLVDVIGSGPFGSFRVGLDFDFAEKHGLRFVAAPLEASETGSLPESVSFAGERFAEGDVDAAYQFSSYRVTYRYRFFDGDRWRWKVGFTGFVRDARIALSQDGIAAEDTDVGFVPLAHLQGRALLGERWRFLFELDGLAGGPGRAFDISAKLVYSFSDDWELGFGYRTIEGGADVDSVFNFAWLNFAVASLRYSF